MDTLNIDIVCKKSESKQDTFRTRVIGDNNCASATAILLDEYGFEKGYDIDSSKWTFVVGRGFEGQKSIIDDRLFKEMVEAQDVSIVRRVCPSCSVSHRDIYYRRLTKMPQEFNLLDTLKNNWFDQDNEFNMDFALYSTYLDAYLDANRWKFCNFKDP